jgi:hypothetical protein
VHAADDLHTEAPGPARSAAGTSAEEQVEGGAPARSRWPEPGAGGRAHLAGGDEGRGGVGHEEQGLGAGEARDMEGGPPARRC